MPAAVAVCDICGHEFGTTQAMPPVVLPTVEPDAPDESAQPTPPKTKARRPASTARPKNQAARPKATPLPREPQRVPWGFIGVAGVILLLVVGAMIFLQRGIIGGRNVSASATIQVQFNDPNVQPSTASAIGLTQTLPIDANATPTQNAIVPTAPQVNLPTPTATAIPPIEYTVARGDTCGAIAQRYSVPLDAFTVLNGLDPVNCLIRVGDTVKIPAPTPTSGPTPTLAPGVTPGPTAASEPTATLPPQLTYIVKGGDSCGKIAEKFNVTVDLIITQNNLDANCLIRADQVLTLTFATPTPAASVTPFVLQTPTPRVGYPAPIILAPLDTASIGETQDVVTLQWLTVGLLQPNEWYVVQVQSSAAITVPIFETKATSLKITQDILGNRIEDEITWWVQVKQFLVTDPKTGTRVYKDTSPSSPPRRFTWRKPMGTATPTPAQ